MSEMVERVALAISGGDDPASILSIHRVRARLAIEAMREPTDDMLMLAGAHAADCPVCNYGGFYGSPDSHKLAAAFYRAMIDEALK